MLAIARRAIEDELCGGQQQQSSEVALPSEFSGVFVTLTHGQRLRGCMGTFEPLGSLAETVDRMARTSCGDDPRFVSNRIRPDELEETHIEVSVLDEPQRTEKPASLVVGKHGILIRRGSSSGCFLPQVAAERGWNAQEFLTQCCATKAGLDPEAWRDPETEVYLFAAEVIAESSRRPTDRPDASHTRA
ncbi:MAG: AmmeMemoRadiSam system protein A [Planctomycetota bacterium]